MPARNKDLEKAPLHELEKLADRAGIVRDKSSEERLRELLGLFETMDEHESTFDDFDLFGFMKAGTPRSIDTEDAKKRADTVGLARVRRWAARYDDWYLIYSFIAKDGEYGFGWETYWDETHRGYSGEKAWYDILVTGAVFPVKYLSSDPSVHYGDVVQVEA
jgi:hypothetical protein